MITKMNSLGPWGGTRNCAASDVVIIWMPWKQQVPEASIRRIATDVHSCCNATESRCGDIWSGKINCLR